jgi:hypothetical protein
MELVVRTVWINEETEHTEDAQFVEVMGLNSSIWVWQPKKPVVIIPILDMCVVVNVSIRAVMVGNILTKELAGKPDEGFPNQLGEGFLTR